MALPAGFAGMISGASAAMMTIAMGAFQLKMTGLMTNVINTAGADMKDSFR